MNEVSITSSNFSLLLAKQYDLHFIKISESWLYADTDDAEVGLRGYELFGHDRQNGLGGGRVLLYAKSDLYSVE